MREEVTVSVICATSEHITKRDPFWESQIHRDSAFPGGHNLTPWHTIWQVESKSWISDMTCASSSRHLCTSNPYNYMCDSEGRKSLLPVICTGGRAGKMYDKRWRNELCYTKDIQILIGCEFANTFMEEDY